MSTQTTPTPVAKSAAEQWLRAVAKKDVASVRELFADDVLVEDPLDTVRGADHFLQTMGQLAEAGVLQGITEPEILGDDTEAAAFFAMQTPAGDLPTAQRITVTDGLISAIRIYFDPRPLTGDGATAG